jgi:DeoR family glycerol-3-phosphate regulon repressor
MNITARQAEIAELVRGGGFQSIEELAERYGVSTQTIRRDVNALCDRGVLLRRHGGVERAPGGPGNLGYETRRVLNLPRKLAIARAVAARIPDGASLAFSIGTTPELVMRALLGHRNLRVFTNNFRLAAVACENPSFEVTVAGGPLRNTDLDVIGPTAAAFFAHYRVDFGIFGVGGIEDDGSLLDFQEGEVEARQAILANCRASLLVADRTKFDRRAVVRGGSLCDVSVFVTDALPPESFVAALAAAGVTLDVAEAAAAGDGAEAREVSAL